MRRILGTAFFIIASSSASAQCVNDTEVRNAEISFAHCVGIMEYTLMATGTPEHQNAYFQSRDRFLDFSLEADRICNYTGGYISDITRAGADAAHTMAAARVQSYLIRQDQAGLLRLATTCDGLMRSLGSWLSTR
jgi:hypothetical protein